MLTTGNNLRGLDRCVHCGIANPNMTLASRTFVNGIHWITYKCASCEKVALVRTTNGQQDGRPFELPVEEMYPTPRIVAEELPERASRYLEQAFAAIHTPDGAAMLAGSAVDAMLKAHDLNDGSVYTRIETAVERGLLTQDMGDWAHEVRLGANRPRHADQDDPHVSIEEAETALEFTRMLGHILFTLPRRVKEGKEKAAAAANA